VAKQETVEAEAKCYTTTFYIGLSIPSTTKQLDIQWPAQEFYETCKGWTKFEGDNMSINVRSVRAWQLPDECFGEDDIRPTKPLKKRKLNEVSSYH